MIRIKRVKTQHFDKIIIPDEFFKNQPSPEKLIRKTVDYCKTGKLEKIYVDKDFVLVDGYCTYLIAKELMESEMHKAVKIRMISSKR